jgi:cytochrome c peroxidase
MIDSSGMRSVFAAVVAVIVVWTPCTAAAELLLGETEIADIVRHGPWPVPPLIDPSNRVSGKPEAIALGRLLFFDKRLSAPGTVACANCHRPDLGWTDGLARAQGIARLDRNAQSLFDVARNRWFGRDGRTDSLWAHSIGPILAPQEMGADPDYISRLMAGDPELARIYRAVFGRFPDTANAQSLLVDIGKALAAFQETIVSGRTAFDDFRDALARGDRGAAALYPESAQRGAALFVGRGKCNVCHTGPGFTNGEFADAGVPYFVEPGRVDPGRQGGIVKLKDNPFNLAGRFNDDPQRSGGWATRQVAELHTNFGTFKVPPLRNLLRTAPYMHDGSLTTLADVVRHYSEINPERLHTDGEKILEPFNFTREEVDDLVAFLKTLSE